MTAEVRKVPPRPWLINLELVVKTGHQAANQAFHYAVDLHNIACSLQSQVQVPIQEFSTQGHIERLDDSIGAPREWFRPPCDTTVRTLKTNAE